MSTAGCAGCFVCTAEHNPSIRPALHCLAPYLYIFVMLCNERDCCPPQLPQPQLISQTEEVGRLSSGSGSRELQQLCHEAVFTQLNQPEHTHTA